MDVPIAKYGRPDIFNTDQGSQFTSEGFIQVLKNHDIKISMDGKGRWVDNVFVERLWKCVKYEHVYLCAYESVSEARQQPYKLLLVLQHKPPAFVIRRTNAGYGILR